MLTPFQITVECADADVMCRFWSTALGYVEEPPPAGYLSWEDFLRANDITMPPQGSIGAIVDPNGVGPRVLFMRMPEQQPIKKCLQLDLRTGRGDDARQTKIDQLTEAGATSVRRIDENGEWWMVMADPEGNEFCVT
jgi:hypothetical protein